MYCSLMACRVVNWWLLLNLLQNLHILLTIHTVHNPLRRPGKTTQHSNSHVQAREIPHVQAREISHVQPSARPHEVYLNSSAHFMEYHSCPLMNIPETLVLRSSFRELGSCLMWGRRFSPQAHCWETAPTSFSRTGVSSHLSFHQKRNIPALYKATFSDSSRKN